MIRPLRERHRRFWSLAAVVLPLLFLVALLLRTPPAVEDDLPPGLRAAAADGAEGNR